MTFITKIINNLNKNVKGVLHVIEVLDEDFLKTMNLK